MFQNYFHTAWRNLTRNRSYSALNILGLSIGMTVALLIGLWVYFQYSFDRFLPNYQQVYQVHQRFIRNGDPSQMTATAEPLSKALRKEIPEIVYAVHTDWINEHNLAAGDKKIVFSGAMAEDGFFDIFPYPVVQGNLTSALKDPYSIVLTESTARSLFGTTDVLNKTVRVDNNQDLIVTAVIKDPPPNSTLNLHYVIPFEYYSQVRPWVRESADNWNNNSFQTFVALKPHTDYASIEPKLKAISDKYNPDAKEFHVEFFLQPMKNWHLYSEFKGGQESGGFIEYVRLFSLVGILVLLIACINFMNLSTARSERRAREVGVRKVIGSRRGDLILQFLIESLVITTIAAMVAMFLVKVLLPSFNTLTRSSIQIPWTSNWFWIALVLYILATGLLAGCRPAFYLSSFQPVKVLKGTIQTGRAAVLPRKVLVVLQFTASIALIISTLLIYQQVQHVKSRPSGFDADRLVMTDGSADLNRHYSALQDELMQTHLIESITRSSSRVTGIWNWSNVQDWGGRYPKETLSMATLDIDLNYFHTMGMQLIAGRDYSGNIATDSSYLIINEAAVKRMRFKEPLDQVITWQQGRKSKIIGVVKDALMLSPFNDPEPTFFRYNPVGANNITYRLSKTTSVHDAITRIAPIFIKYNPAFPFQYHFEDLAYAAKFQLEVLVGRLAALFAGLAIFISCLGLFGLAAYTAEQRTREIGIRKVLGASLSQLWLLLSKDFLLLVVISCVVASPIAFYFLHQWLRKYPYRITIGPGVFILAGVAALAITLITVSFQAIRGALANPVKSLRSE